MREISCVEFSNDYLRRSEDLGLASYWCEDVVFQVHVLCWLMEWFVHICELENWACKFSPLFFVFLSDWVSCFSIILGEFAFRCTSFLALDCQMSLECESPSCYILGLGAFGFALFVLRRGYL